MKKLLLLSLSALLALASCGKKNDSNKNDIVQGSAKYHPLVSKLLGTKWEFKYDYGYKNFQNHPIEYNPKNAEGIYKSSFLQFDSVKNSFKIINPQILNGDFYPCPKDGNFEIKKVISQNNFKSYFFFPIANTCISNTENSMLIVSEDNGEIIVQRSILISNKIKSYRLEEYKQVK